jgi:hypothetical protein
MHSRQIEVAARVAATPSAVGLRGDRVLEDKTLRLLKGRMPVTPYARQILFSVYWANPLVAAYCTHVRPLSRQNWLESRQCSVLLIKGCNNRLLPLLE